ncbi:MAG: NrfD/PsrC family molybdoenzyme membrane anchor subunit [Vicinamibacterales bacterium]
MEPDWGLLIVLYLFLGGMSAGLLAASAAATLFGGGRFPAIAVRGALAAPWPVAVGTGLLVFDLGRPLYFWKLLVAFEPQSPMWLGTWVLTIFLAVSLPYAALFLPDPLRVWRPVAPAAWRRRLAGAGLAVAVAVGIYTGVLLGVLVARPLWNTPLLAQLFLVSGLSSGAAILLLGQWQGRGGEHRALVRADLLLIALELVVIGWMVAEASTSTALARSAFDVLLSGTYAWVFWLGVVGFGLVVPLVLEALEASGGRLAAVRPGLHLVAPALVVAGGLLLRWVIVYAGQAAPLA